MKGWSTILWDTVHLLNQKVVYGALSLIKKIHKSGNNHNQGIEAGVVLFTITPTATLNLSFLFPHLELFRVADLSPKGAFS